MNEHIENTLRAEEKAIVALQDITYHPGDARQESRLKHAESSYGRLFHKYFPRPSSAQLAYANTTQRIADIENTQQALEENILTERVELKSPTREIRPQPSAPSISPEPLRRPQKNKNLVRLNSAVKFSTRLNKNLITASKKNVDSNCGQRDCYAD